jgi:hypothetical protein
MPRQLISDAHEWINEIPTVRPYLLSSETTAKGTGLAKAAGKEDPVELDSSLTLSGGEFGWGGTSGKRQCRCPKGDSSRTEISSRTKG